MITVLTAIGCSDPVQPIRTLLHETQWELSEDSINVAVLKVNRFSKTFEGGWIGKFPFNPDDTAQIPIDDTIDYQGDATYFAFRVGANLDTILHLFTDILGGGAIFFPNEILTPDHFVLYRDSSSPPTSFWNFIEWGTSKWTMETDWLLENQTLWHGIYQYDIVHEFSKRDYFLGYYQYTPYDFYPEARIKNSTLVVLMNLPNNGNNESRRIR